MKEILSNNKIIYGVIGLIIILGIIISVTIGFKYELKYDENESFDIYIGKEFTINEMQELLKDVFNGKKVVAEYVEEFKDTVCITTTNITEEEKASFVQKINEKYELEYTVDNINVISNSQVKLIDMLKQSILPILWCSTIITAYFMIVYRKEGIVKVFVTSILTIVISQALLFSIIAIVRFHIGRFTLLLIIAAYIISIASLICKFEKIKSNLKPEKKK